MEKDLYEGEEKQESEQGAEKKNELVPGSGRKAPQFADTYVLKRNMEYETNEGRYHYQTDSKGRIVNASGKLQLEEGKRYGNHQSRVGGEDRLEKRVEGEKIKMDEGGHLIATRFGGSGRVDNLVAMDKEVNRGAYKKLEDQWASELKKEPPREVEVDIQVRYRGDSQRPDRFIILTTVRDPQTGKADTYSNSIKNR